MSFDAGRAVQEENVIPRLLTPATRICIAPWPRSALAILLSAALLAAACGTDVKEASEVVLARHVHTDLYDAYPGIPSPAGDRVVFADYAADKRSLTVYDVVTGVGRAVTSTPGGRTRVTWSPDGSRVVYVDRQSDRHGVWALDPATGRESRIVDPGDARIDYPRLLPDGTVTALRYAGADTAWVAYAPGVDRAMSVVVDRAGGWVAPVRSPDGRAVAYLRVADGRAALAVTEVATGETRTLAADLRLGWDRRVEWSPTGGALLLAAAGTQDSLFVAWRVPVDGGPAERLERSGRDVLAVTPLADGRVALSVYHTRTAVGLLPVTGGEPTDVTTAGSTAGSTSAFLPSWHPGGEALGFITFSWRRVRMPIDFDLGILDLDAEGAPTGTVRTLLSEEGEDYGAAWSPDDRWLAFHSHMEQSDDIWLVPAGGSERPTRLTHFGPGADTGEPDWSPDGRMLAFSSHGPPLEGNPGSVYAVAVDPATGRAAADPVRVPLDGFQGYAMGARFSPDGERLAFYGRSFEDGRVTVYTVPAAGGRPTVVISFVNGEPYSAPEWSADGASLFYSRNDGVGPFQVWRVDISTGATEQVTTGALGALQPSVSPDGRTLAVTMREAAIEVVALATGSAVAGAGSGGW
ncbi:TolB family protein [Candidatus Palauibacter irciniicola]|uniref:TolB family protein n=1 Tax=Candidatus Palauibacter irciniicola TaxID=3056733 RepID=UPI003B023AFC